MLWKKKRTFEERLQSLDDITRLQLSDFRYKFLVLQVRETGLLLQLKSAEKNRDAKDITMIDMKLQDLHKEYILLKRNVKTFVKHHRIDRKLLKLDDPSWQHVGF